MRLSANPSPLMRYGFAVVITIIAIGLSLFFRSFLQPSVFLLFFPAIILSAGFGGLVVRSISLLT